MNEQWRGLWKYDTLIQNAKYMINKTFRPHRDLCKQKEVACEYTVKVAVQ